MPIPYPHTLLGALVGLTALSLITDSPILDAIRQNGGIKSQLTPQFTNMRCCTILVLNR